MKRLVIAVSLLLTIIVTCLVNLWMLSQKIGAMIDTLSISQQALSQGDVRHSADLLQDSYEQFNQADFLLSITINEKQLDEVYSNFSRALEGQNSEDSSQYAMELAALKESILDLKRSEMPTFGNLL